MKTYLLIFFSITFASCNKTKIDNLLNITDYPVKVGDKWTYQITNNTSNKTDTAIIAITAQNILSTDSIVYQTQTYVNGGVIDSGTLILSSTSYKYKPTSELNSIFEHIELTFPINVKSIWTGTQGRDTLRVIESNQTFTVMGNTFTNVTEVVRIAVDPQLFNVVDTMFICPKVGIIQLDADIISAENKTIRLISYQLN